MAAEANDQHALGRHYRKVLRSEDVLCILITDLSEWPEALAYCGHISYLGDLVTNIAWLVALQACDTTFCEIHNPG